MTASFPWLAARGYAPDAATGCWLPGAERPPFPYTDGEHVEVVEPESLRRSIAARLERARAAYR